jgi:hypothetical protein
LSASWEDRRVDVADERVRDRVHAANGLEHRALLFEARDRSKRAPGVRLQDVAKLVGGGFLARSRTDARAGVDLVAAAVRADVGHVVGREIAFTAQVREEQLLVARTKGLVERTLLDTLGQHLGRLAADVRGDLLLANRLGGERPFGPAEVHEGVVVVVDEDLERHPELLGVMQHGLVMVGEPPRTVVDVEPVVEVAGLGRPAELGKGKSLPGRLAASARERARLKQHDLVAGVRQFVGRRESGDPRAQHDDLLAGAAAGQGGRRRVGRLDAEPQRAHTRQEQGGAADGAEALQERSARQRGGGGDFIRH